MQHFLEINTLSYDQIENLIQRALFFKSSKQYPQHFKTVVANLFCENSTRTRVSFELAAMHLGMKVINFDYAHSSVHKGETLLDTVKTIQSMGVNILVMRHGDNTAPLELAKSVGDEIHIVNAGSGQYAHPSQALLDMMTIIEHKQSASDLKIVLLGDIAHSRVARSFQAIAKIYSVRDLVMVAPQIWHPKTIFYGQITDDLQVGIQDADVVICLRTQYERMTESDSFSLADYQKHYTLTSQVLGLAKQDVLVMHPGPMNRGIEIDSNVADGQHSVILQQVQNGVFARMAILDAMAVNH